MAVKVAFIKAKAELEIDIPAEILDKLPKKIGLVTTIQHLDKVAELKNKIGAVSVSRVLGCSATSAAIYNDKVDAFLYIGTGDFHPLEVGLRTGKDVYIFNPISKELKMLDKGKIESIKKRRKGAFLKFLTSENIGLLVSSKSGQNNIKTAWQLRDLFKEKFPEKKCYVFGFNTLDFGQLENFPFIDVWIGTACPRMATDDHLKFNRPLIDARELKEDLGIEVPKLISTFS